MIQNVEWYWDILRNVFAFFDVLVYGLLNPVIHGFFDMINISTNSELFNGIYIKIYVILGIFMAFKLTFSFFRYLINPDLMTEKNKGVGKLFIRVFTMLFALMFLPSLLFTGIGGKGGLLPRAQEALLPLVPKLVLGGTGYADVTDQNIDKTADTITITTLSAFFYPPVELEGHCWFWDTYNNKPIESLTDFAFKVNETCSLAGSAELINLIAKYVFNTNLKFYKYRYIPIVSTAVGILLVGMFLAISIDVAKRIFKLIVLQVIAPIPIMSLIDPATNYSDTAFSKWLKNIISTFADIFIKTGLVYITLIFIDKLATAVNATGTDAASKQFISGLPTDPARKSYIVVLMILGLVFFAKQAPKFIKESLGMKAEKGGLFDDVKSLAKISGVVGAYGLGATAAVARNTIGTASAGVAAYRKNGALAAAGTIASGLTFGALRSAAVGAFEGRKAMGKSKMPFGGIIGGWKGQGQRNMQRTSYAAQGSSFVGRTMERFNRGVMGMTSEERYKRDAEAKKAISESFKEFQAVMDKISGETMVKVTNPNTGNDIEFAYGDYLSALETHDEEWFRSVGFDSMAQAANGKMKKDITEIAHEATLDNVQRDFNTYNPLREKIEVALRTHTYTDVDLINEGITDDDAAKDALEALTKAVDNREKMRPSFEAIARTTAEVRLDNTTNFDSFDEKELDAIDKNMQRRVNEQLSETTSVLGRNKYKADVANSQAINNKKK